MSIQDPHEGWGPSLNLEAQIVKFEQFTITPSMIPLVGTVLGVAKVALGFIQVFFGSLVMLAMVFPSIASARARATFCRGFSHLVNGGANIIAGALEATWIFAIPLAVVRDKTTNIPSSSEPNICLEIPVQERLMVAYEGLRYYSSGRWKVLGGTTYTGFASYPEFQKKSASDNWVSRNLITI